MKALPPFITSAVVICRSVHVRLLGGPKFIKEVLFIPSCDLAPVLVSGLGAVSCHKSRNLLENNVYG